MARLRQAAFLLALTLAASCSFGHKLERPDDQSLVENLGANRYLYSATRLLQEAPRAPAAPVIAAPPEGARELALIEVAAEYGGLGAGGLRGSEAEFYPTLSRFAGELGGTHFLVTRSTRETRMGNWITALTVDVLSVAQK